MAKHDVLNRFLECHHPEESVLYGSQWDDAFTANG